MDIEYVKKLIKAFGVSKKDLANYLGYHVRTLERKLKGEIQFSPTEVVLLANYFDKPIEDFFISDLLFYQGD